jgi:Cytochrome b5-like Heme/Steroid binding domain
MLTSSPTTITVYDLTTFAPDHPGGIDVLKDCAGTDGSETYEYAGHDDDQMRTLDKYRVGVLEGSDDATGVRLRQGTAEKSTGAARTGTLERALPNLGAYIPLPVVGATLGALAVLFWALKFTFGRMGSSDADLQLRQGVNPIYAFWGGLLLASSLSCAGLGLMYSQFSETLQHEQDVFHYPAVIPRKAAG